MHNETPTSELATSESGGGAQTVLPPGGGTLGGGRFRMAPRYHSYLMYGLMTLGTASVGIWYYVRWFLCWRDSFDISPGGSIACTAHRGTYATLLLAAFVFGFLAVELSWLGFEAEPGARRRGIRTAYRGYRSLERREFIHVTVATAWTLSILGLMFWFRVLSDWSF